MKKLNTIILTTLISVGIHSYAYSAAKPYSQNIKQVTEKKIDKKLKYDIKIDYPTLQNLSNKTVENKINKDIKARISALKAPFIKEIYVPEASEPALPDEINTNEMSVSYEAMYMDKDKISLLVNVFTFYRGSAHPNSEMISFNYDLKTGNRIELKDLFKPNTNYLKVLSDYSIKDLDKRLLTSQVDPTWIKTGAGPKLENFDTFNFTKDKLIIHFQNYQVASYADGPQEVVIPFSALSKVRR